MPAEPGRILVFGSINADLLFRMDRLPAAGQTLLAAAMTVQPGGKGANQAVAARNDGATVHMVGAVGDDALAAPALDGLRRAGVDLGAVRHHAGQATGCASICTDREGRNQIAVALGANALLTADQVPASLLSPATTVVLQMEASQGEIEAVIRRAREAGCRIILNLAPALPLDRAALRLLDLLVVNEDEAATLAETLACAADAGALHAALAVGVIRTMGAEGAEAATSAVTCRAASPRVQAVDTTAAGDCFVGVLAAALARGIDLPSKGGGRHAGLDAEAGDVGGLDGAFQQRIGGSDPQVDEAALRRVFAPSQRRLRHHRLRSVAASATQRTSCTAAQTIQTKPPTEARAIESRARRIMQISQVAVLFCSGFVLVSSASWSAYRWPMGSMFNQWVDGQPWWMTLLLLPRSCSAPSP